MDELSLLVDDAIEADAAASSLPSLPAPDFTGSLDYIDSLASRSSISISRRDIANITTALSTYDYLSPLVNSRAVPLPADAGVSSTDFRPLGDARRFDPEFSVRPPRALSRASSRVIASSPRADFPPGYRNPLDPTRDVDDLNRVVRETERRVTRNPWANRFSEADRVVICLKRRIRRQMMHAMGFAGRHYFRKPRLTYWSQVIC